MLLRCEDITFGYNNSILFKNVTFNVKYNDRLGITAKSGFGKSTLAKIISGYQVPLSGNVFVDNKPILKNGYNPIQLIYQHPEKAINPLWKMKKVIKEANIIGNKYSYIIDELKISRDWFDRYSYELSSGELQRFCIARVLGENTKFIVADEITTMFDAISQAEIWHFLIDECNKRNIGMIIITHNIELLNKISTNTVNLEDYNSYDIR